MERSEEARLAVLYVDDEPANLTAFRYAYADRFPVLTARSPDEALQLLAGGGIAVLLADQRMPGMTGADLCGIVRERHPEVVRMILTAFADAAAAAAAVNNGQVLRYMFKPWREEELAGVLIEGIKAHALGRMVHDLQVRMVQTEQQLTSSTLLRRILHEVASPTQSIHNNLQWIADSLGPVLEEARGSAPGLVDRLAEISSALADALAAAVELAARVHRFKAGEMPSPAMTRVDLRRSIDAALAIVRTDLRRKAIVVTDLGDTLPVLGHAGALSQILVNLLSNAAESIEAGHPDDHRITVRCRSEGAVVVVEIEDTGCGIPAELLPHIFEPFVSTRGLDPARGLGLAIVKDVVASLGGELGVTSEVGRGTTFSVRLPAADAPPALVGG